MNSSCFKLEQSPLALAVCAVILLLPFTSRADTYTINNTTADAFLASGPSGNSLAANNYGGAGTLAIAPASSTKGEFDSVIKFNTVTTISQFNSTYGSGDWTITGLTLKLASNTGTVGNPGNAIFNNISGGNFGIDWIPNDSWVEGTGNPNMPSATGVNFNSIPTLIATYDSLGTYTYTPPGNNVYISYTLPLDTGLVNDAAAGGDVSLYFYAADNQISYLFNSRSFSQANPELTFTITPVPEPGIMSLLAVSLGGILCLWKQKSRS